MYSPYKVDNITNTDYKVPVYNDNNSTMGQPNY